MNKVNESKQNNISKLEKIIVELEKNNEALQKEKKEAEENLQLKAEQKEKKIFFDFCYEMAKSIEKDNLDMKKECWKILKKRYSAEM